MKIDGFMQLGRRFFLLQIGTTLSLLTAHVFRFALAWWCLQETHSAVAFSSLIAFSVATEVYLKPFLAAFGDQFHRGKFILSGQCIVFIVIVLLSLACSAGYFHLVAVTAGLVVISAVASAREPTIMGLIPDLVAEGEVSRAIASRSAINSVIALSAPLLVASLVGLFSASVALYVAVVLQGFSCLAFALLMKSAMPAHPAHKSASWLSKTREGFRAIYHVKSERYIALISALINFTLFPFFSVAVPYWIITQLHLSPWYLGAFECSFALGLLSGSLYFNRVLSTGMGRFGTVIVGFVCLGGSVMGIVVVANMTASIALAFFSGLAFIFINVNLSTLRSIATPGHYRARMAAMAAFLSSLANPFGVIIAGWYLHWLGVTLFAVACGVVVMLMALVLLWSSHLKKALSLDEREMKGYYQKTYPEAFRERGEKRPA
ncbi:MFS transporter [Kosakonia sp. BK9b]